jgi:hypothetical protein
MIDHARVGGEAGHGAAEVAVDLHDLLDGGVDEEGRLDALLDAEDDALGGLHADGRGTELGEDAWSRMCLEYKKSGAYLDSFDRVLDYDCIFSIMSRF